MEIRPIDYAYRMSWTLHAYNTSNGYKLTDIDAKILLILSVQPRGMRAMTCMKAIAPTMYAVTFTKAINRLLSMHCIAKVKHRMYVYYNINMKGRIVLQDLNETLIKLTNEYAENIGQDVKLNGYKENKTRKDFDHDYQHIHRLRASNA